ncbi:hypothetical protein [Streptomyces sp. NPDC053720]|uniref:hypothetical protein n=1 Tax=Streptomyces sp. NPDC053720 TaxID=3154855 RepID=UPI0034378010
MDRGIRRASWLALALLVPVVVGSGLLALTTTRASGCPTYGVNRADVPYGSIHGCFFAALLPGVPAAVRPGKQLPFASAHGRLLGLHGVARLMTASLILGHA